MNVIVTCGCGDTDSFARDAFKIIFPGEPLPQLISQRAQIGEIAKWQEEIDALFRADAKFAYYLTDTEMWDLLKGVRVA